MRTDHNASHGPVLIFLNFLQNFSERQIVRSFSCFYIEIAYLNFTFCGT